MVGMLQFITDLLCVYLVFKGVEIFQIALSSLGLDGLLRTSLLIGVTMVAGSIVAAVAFSIWITDQTVGIQGNLPTMPR